MKITRRVFLRNSALAVVGTAAVPSFLTRAAMGAVQPGARTKRLVVIFQRGAADGLNIVVPHGEAQYYAMRPSINIPRKDVLDLDGFFGLHPSLAPFQPLWQQRHLAIVHAAGSPDPSRSHFDAQDFMEAGTPGVKSTEDGWLNRALRSMPQAAQKSAFEAIAMGPSIPRILSGIEPAVAMNNINDFSVGGRNQKASPAATAFEAMYDHSADTVLHGTAEETFDAVRMLKSADPTKYKPAPGADYPKGRLGDSLRQLAQLIKANRWRAGCVCRYWRLGPSRERRRNRRPDSECAARLLAVDRRLLDRSRRSWGRYGGCDDVGVWPHRAREWQSRYRPRARQCDVRAGWSGERRQSLWPLAWAGSIAAI